MTPVDLDADVAGSQRAWRDVRRYLNSRRHGLAGQATKLYAHRRSIRGLVVDDGWQPPTPVPLDRIRLSWRSDAPRVSIRGSEPESASVRPLKLDGQRFESYAEALGSLDRPALFEDRPCYRLVSVGVEGERPVMEFTRATFFDIINVCEAAAHEFASQTRQDGQAMVGLDGLPFRTLVGDPCDLGRRPVIPAISVLTVRRSTRGTASFVLHRRDSAKVAHGGGLFQVMPVGVFQPSAPGEWNEGNDFDLWRSIAREYSEEFLGAPELAGVDYDAWPFFQQIQAARDSGQLKVHWLGLGVDPLSLVTDVLLVAVFEDVVFDELFGRLVVTNAEGDVVSGASSGGSTEGIPFTEASVRRFTGDEPMQAAGAAVLDLAWQHRELLLG